MCTVSSKAERGFIQIQPILVLGIIIIVFFLLKPRKHGGLSMKSAKKIAEMALTSSSSKNDSSSKHKQI